MRVTPEKDFPGNRFLEEMPHLYKIADAMLVTLEDKPYANMTIPGKVQSYMAAGKPIIGAVNGSCANFISDNNIGFCCNAGDSDELAKLIKSLNIKNLYSVGNNSKRIYISTYRKELFITYLLKALKNN